MTNSSILKDDIRTGFAVFMRNLAIHELKIQVGGINDVPYQQYQEKNWEMWVKYLNDKTYKLSNTLLLAPLERSSDLLNGPNLWSFFWWDLYQQKGNKPEFLQKFLSELWILPPPKSEHEIFTNFLKAANRTNPHISIERISKKWKWDVSQLK